MTNEIIHTDWVGKWHLIQKSRKPDSFWCRGTIRRYALWFPPKPVVFLLSLPAPDGCRFDTWEKTGKKFTAFRISAKGELADDFPKSYRTIHLVYIVTGPGFKDNWTNQDKGEPSVRLFQDNYCAGFCNAEKFLRDHRRDHPLDS